MTQNTDTEEKHPAKEWYDQFDIGDRYYGGGHFVEDPTNASANFTNPPENVIQDARESARDLGLAVHEHHMVHGPYESVYLRVFEYPETTYAEIMVEQGIPDRLHEAALYEREHRDTDKEINQEP